MKAAIVTGANGFIGRELIRKLIENKTERIIAIDIAFSGSEVLENPAVIKIQSDLSDMETLLRSVPVQDYDAFYHLAWRGVNGSEKADPLIQLENEKIVLRCAAAAKQMNCKKFLCAGTIAEQSVHSLTDLTSASGGMMYGAAKYCTQIMLETYCKNIQQDFVWMQFSNIYGPNNKTGNLVSYTISQLKNNQEATFGPAVQPYDFIYVDDLIEAVYRLGNSAVRYNQYFIGSGEPRLLKDYLLEIGCVFGKEELIRIGVRPDDGIKYTMDMFDTSRLAADIGEYTSMSFSEAIRYTIENY